MPSLLITLLLAPFVLAGFMPLAARWLGSRVGWLALAGPVVSLWAVVRLLQLPAAAREAVSWTWLPSLGVNATFAPDGLALFFALVVSGIGVLVTFYSAHYLDNHYRDHGRFYCYLLLFMGSMLMTVLASNLLVLFVAWELTGLTSFLLIGFLHDKEDSQRGARMALLTTALTGLALLAGVVLLRVIFGSFELSDIIGAPVPAGREGLLLAAFLCCFTGIAGKSAQFPFHYWLPNAMAAPTPVSAYLHSATMVKLGVFLAARLLPVFGGLESWMPVLTGFGFGTLLLGAVLALFSQDLKGVLAYTTVAQLGLLVGYYGLLLELERPLEHGSGERIVDNGRDAMRLRERADMLHVDDIHRRIGRSLEEEDLRVRSDRLFPRVIVAAIDDGRLDPEAGTEVIDQPAARTKGGTPGHDVIARRKLA